ncbi:MAG: TauD/TfdA family dioxygenase [Alphaproteobacteria bacterium]|nr:TauD/TfdA family dioxygenase [Alphaproteobacteria bacterium]
MKEYLTPDRHLAATGRAIWHGSDYTHNEDWIYRLTAENIAELHAAVKGISPDTDLQTVGTQQFPLPTLASQLCELQREVVEGRGFVLIKGVPIERYNRFEAAALSWGIGQYFGTPVSQNADGHLLGHVKDLGYPKNDPRHRGYQTREPLRYHTDSCDIVGLMCLHHAKSGGFSSIVSAGAIHNAILETRPDLLDVLYEPFHISRIGEIPEGKQASYPMPVFNAYAGHMTSMYPARDLRMGQTLPEVPPLTPKQEEALALLDEYAEAFSLKMEIAPGDIQFLHNHTIYHSRTAYEDYEAADRRRHMLRLWLSAPNGRALPPYFAERYGPVEVGAVRGGILCPGTTLSTPLNVA